MISAMPLLLHVLGTTSLVWIWFCSDFPVFATKLLRSARALRESLGWPDDITYKHWLRHEWEDWISSRYPFTAHWMTCPTCFATRASGVSALWVAAWTWDWTIIPFCVVSVPIACTWLKIMAKK